MELHAVAREGDVEKAQQLISEGADVNEKDKLSRTPLHMAAWAGQASMVQLLCASGAQPNATAADDMTSLHFAAQKGHEEALRFLLAARAKPLLVTRKGLTALHFAVQNKSLSCVRALAKKAPDAMGLVSGKGQSPIDLAKTDEMKDLLKTLAAEAAALKEKKRAQAKEKEEVDALGSKRKKHGNKEGMAAGEEPGGDGQANRIGAGMRTEDGAAMGSDGEKKGVSEQTAEVPTDVTRSGSQQIPEIGPMMRNGGGANSGPAPPESNGADIGPASFRDDVGHEGPEGVGEKAGGIRGDATRIDVVEESRKGSKKRGADKQVEGVVEPRLTALQRAKLKSRKAKIGLSHLEEDE